jgi:hypothetical protein
MMQQPCVATPYIHNGGKKRVFMNELNALGGLEAEFRTEAWCCSHPCSLTALDGRARDAAAYHQ